MIKIGNFLFHYRNGLFPLAYALLFVPAATLFENDWLAAFVGFVVAMTGQLLRAVTIGLAYIIRGGRKRRIYAGGLVTGGMFSHCRNPLYLGNILTILGLGLASDSLLFLALVVPFFLVGYLAIIVAEEDYLRGKFGPEFDDYCRRVNRILPRLSGLGKTMGSMEFQWRRLLIKEYGSTFAWMVGMTLVVAKNRWLHRGLDAGSNEIWMLAGVGVLLILAYTMARFVKKRGWFKPSEYAGLKPPGEAVT